jgi:hypothetical protein
MDDKMYEAVLSTLVVTKGLLKSDNGFWGSHAAEDYFEAGKHIRACGWTSSHVDENYTWSVFGGTFTNHDTTCHGIVVTITCKCGKYTDRDMLYERNTSEAIRDVLEMAEILIDKKADDK